ncbi:MAG: MmcQ/YjbR family DNA-binding protein [Acidobacteria bacterium]|nr:MmcQ/YjbR family DNA-binding protein [Acidobacteriota bacterium]
MGLFNVTQKVADKRRARVVAIVTGLPEAGVEASGNHLSLEVRQKRFGWYLEDHHGEGRLALNCKAARSVAQQFAKNAPDRFHIPKFVGRLGWIGLWLDTPQVDWKEVEAILVEAYRLTAPKKLIAELDAEQNTW